MPCKYVIAMDGAVVVERWTGAVTLDELMAHKQQQFLDPSIKEGASVLSDCTRASFEISADAISELSAMDNDPHNKSNIRRHSFLVGNDAHDKAQQFADQVDESGKSVIIFNSLHVASAWPGMDLPKVRELIECGGD